MHQCETASCQNLHKIEFPATASGSRSPPLEDTKSGGIVSQTCPQLATQEPMSALHGQKQGPNETSSSGVKDEAPMAHLLKHKALTTSVKNVEPSRDRFHARGWVKAQGLRFEPSCTWLLQVQVSLMKPQEPGLSSHSSTICEVSYGTSCTSW